jgi:hypothetical protein
VLTGRNRRLALAAAALACSALPAAALATTPVAHEAKMKFIFLKARVVSDGFVTPNQLETISVSNLPARTAFKVFLEPPPVTLQCGEFYFCDTAPTQPAPGTPPYRSNSKGKATVTFSTPPSYFVETDPFHPSRGTLVNWMNGQAVHIDVEAIKRNKKVRKDSFGFARAVVQLPG